IPQAKDRNKHRGESEAGKAGETVGLKLAGLGVAQRAAGAAGGLAGAVDRAVDNACIQPGSGAADATVEEDADDKALVEVIDVVLMLEESMGGAKSAPKRISGNQLSGV